MFKTPRTRVIVLTSAGLASLTLVLAAAVQTRAYRPLTVFQEVWSLTRSNYVEPVDEAALIEGAMRGMVGALDGASAYLAPGEEKLLASPPGPGRSGMEVLPSGGAVVVVRVDPGGPAARAGLSVGDQVWRLAGKPVRQRSWPEMKRRLSGAPGETLDLLVLDGADFKLREVKVALEAPKGRQFAIQVKDGPVVHARLFDIDFLDAALFARELSSTLAERSDARLLLDLRGVVGLDPASYLRAASAFAPAATALRVVPRSGAEEALATGPPVAPVIRPDFVLVDATTAGTGEALAALVRERSGAKLCGRGTYGLGSLPELIPLPRGGAVLLTTREMKTPGGASWSDSGLSPEKVLTPPAARAADGGADRDALLDEAVRWIMSGAAPDEQPASVRPAA